MIGSCLIGRQFNRLYVAGEAERINGRKAYACICECGKKSIVSRSNLTTGAVKSCGCYLSDKNKLRLSTHGKSGSKIYRIWRDMINRCHYEKYPERHLYGGRGIKVCDRWRNSFEEFYKDMGDPPEGKTLDRVNNDGNYEPENCRWATPIEQAANRRKPNKIINTE